MLKYNLNLLPKCNSPRTVLRCPTMTFYSCKCNPKWDFNDNHRVHALKLSSPTCVNTMNLNGLYYTLDRHEKNAKLGLIIGPVNYGPG